MGVKSCYVEKGEDGKQEMVGDMKFENKERNNHYAFVYKI